MLLEIKIRLLNERLFCVVIIMKDKEALRERAERVNINSWYQ